MLDRFLAMQTIQRALMEDIGPRDLTSTLLIPPGDLMTMRLVAREQLVVAGVDVAADAFRLLDPDATVDVLAGDGEVWNAGETLATIVGNAQALLSAERTALNLLQRMCGVATLTRRYVDAVEGTGVVILDTRKTMPGLRLFDKYATTCGGAQNHRMGLYDAVMVKDNHLEVRGQGPEARGKGMKELVREIREKLTSLTSDPRPLIPIIIECDTLEQVAAAIDAAPDRILLDNMSNDQLRQAVALNAGRVKLEASGGVSLQTVRGIAETGVDYISVGRITHSVPAADIGADVG